MLEYYTHMYLERVIENENDEILVKSELNIELPEPLEVTEAQKPQEELWTWIIAEFPGFIPVAYYTKKAEVNE
tara:strand:+ start:44 stop:262 length:219 start_codon:yes stop_codon:yes gene_type:complete